MMYNVAFDFEYVCCCQVWTIWATFDTPCLQNKLTFDMYNSTGLWFCKAGVSHTYRSVATLKLCVSDFKLNKPKTGMTNSHNLTSSQSSPCALYVGIGSFFICGGFFLQWSNKIIDLDHPLYAILKQLWLSLMIGWKMVHCIIVVLVPSWRK